MARVARAARHLVRARPWGARERTGTVFRETVTGTGGTIWLRPARPQCCGGPAGVAFVLIAVFGLVALCSDALAANAKIVYLTSVIAVIGTVTLFGVFTKMNRGIGPHNLKAIGIVFVAVLVALLAVSDTESESVLGILGAIVGYLFGKDSAAGSTRSE